LTRFGRALPIELREFKMITAYHLAQDRYQPQFYDGHVTIFTAEQRDAEHLLVPDHMGWAEWTNRLRVIQSPGHHDTLFQTPHVAILIRNLADVLRGEDIPASHAGDGATASLRNEIG
jgi:thioesterase domain-containing protein